MKGLFYLVVTMVVIIACTNEEFDANSEVKKEEVKTKIASLAEKYDVNVDFFEINPSEKTENEMSLEEIEELFRDIKQLREHPVELKMYKDKEENGCMFYSTKEQKPSVPLAKTRSEIYSFSDWIWNLTWFSVTLIEDNKNVTVMTDITGLSVYTITHLQVQLLLLSLHQLNSQEYERCNLFTCFYLRPRLQQADQRIKGICQIYGHRDNPCL